MLYNCLLSFESLLPQVYHFEEETKCLVIVAILIKIYTWQTNNVEKGGGGGGGGGTFNIHGAW
jgi:hypothetical protein